MKPGHVCIDSPLGFLELVDGKTGIQSIQFGAHIFKPRWNDRLREMARQLKEYFEGKRTEFQIPLDPEGTEFQKRVWKELQKIPFGSTRSYGEIARALGKPGAARAIGQASGNNPIPILIPCHRVIGSRGQLTGYSGGMEIKIWLLRHEGFPLSP